jgi:hypothetical protein
MFEKSLNFGNYRPVYGEATAYHMAVFKKNGYSISAQSS